MHTDMRYRSSLMYTLRFEVIDTNDLFCQDDLDLLNSGLTTANDPSDAVTMGHNYIGRQ